jgi:hypothetical protein
VLRAQQRATRDPQGPQRMQHACPTREGDARCLADPSAPRGAASATHVRTCENHAKRRVRPRCPTTGWRQRLSSHGNPLGNGVRSGRVQVPVPHRVAAPVLSCPKVSVSPGSSHTCPGTHMHVMNFCQSLEPSPQTMIASAISQGKSSWKPQMLLHALFLGEPERTPRALGQRDPKHHPFTQATT